ncbi:helix-turn-helix domain-containing protein [Paenibacillus sedimenti]|uniref:Helix-turn-helix transcriptional regulator n=1 Tax=Paenibacillus sedimenti TaxID=2770274 RepID=A0A926KRI1_9BACL|nr:helix-turn-helix transcriptional regulator [Paenibacillus sedimenti]MBD0382635.1 helix-turn-helix transcriptional regulator [Paenibacillus sedimenti]
MSDFLRLVGERLRMIREEKNLTQSQVAEKTGIEGISKSRISDIERGRSNISLKTLEKIMRALDISPNELFSFQELDGVEGIEEKKMILDVHKYMLMERDINEIKYVVRTAKDFLNTIDAKDSKGKKR